MKRVTGKRVSLLIIMAVMILMVTGCGSESKGDKQTSSGTVQESQSTSGSENQSSDNNEGQESDFDFSQAFDNVEVNGKKVPFPFTLNDLGEGFKVEAVTEMGDGRCCGTLYYKDEIVAGVYMKISSKDEFNDNTKINSMDLSNLDIQMIKINGIDCNNNVDDVRNSYIGLEEKYDENNNINFMRKYSGENYISYYFHEDGTIITIRMGKGE